MKTCENCNIEIDGSFGAGRFCSRKCQCSFSTKEKREEINEKVSVKLKTSINKVCPTCNSDFETQLSRDGIFCSISCSMKNRWSDENYRNNMSTISKNRCDNIEERNRMKEIGRKGGFGKKGYTKGNNRFESTLEKICFEYLEDNGVDFVAHKPIPNSSKISDVYLIDTDLWVEIDGINREKRKKWLKENYNYWLDKISIYERENLKFLIVKNFDEFKKII